MRFNKNHNVSSFSCLGEELNDFLKKLLSDPFHPWKNKFDSLSAATQKNKVREKMNKERLFLRSLVRYAEGEIRTPVARSATGFQDRRRGPLGYLSMVER
jgi:hypothetical protein